MDIEAIKPLPKDITIPETSELKKVSEVENKNIFKDQLETIKYTPRETLRAQNDARLESLREQNNQRMNESSLKKPGLSEDEKNKVKEAHPDWPPEIIDAIGSWKEYEIYDKAGLVYAEINGKPCLIRPDIDMNQKDVYGRTNKERIELGLSPLNKNNEPIELHHIGQKPDSPLAELTEKEHRGKVNDGILHDKTKESEINRGEFQREKKAHWDTRAREA
jgi:hypothetical protein